MNLRITVDIFSGRPNPVIELRGREAAAALERLTPESLRVAGRARSSVAVIKADSLRSNFGTRRRPVVSRAASFNELRRAEVDDGG